MTDFGSYLKAVNGPHSSQLNRSTGAAPNKAFEYVRYAHRTTAPRHGRSTLSMG